MTTISSTPLDHRLDGDLLTPGDPRYDESRSVWNAMIDRRPVAIARCANSADVVVAVRFAREQDLEIGVRCGGHNIAGMAVPDGGLMIDLRSMGAVTIDFERRRARVQGGALLGALDRAAQRVGLTTTAGNVSHTGVGGLTLGGGMGWLARRCGLACDNVVAYTLVTADGEVLHVTAEEHPELFWGLRGGGGNFGIVTEFEFRLHPVDGRTLVAELSFAEADAAAALGGWRELALSAPREATFTATLTGDRLELGYVWVGDPARGARLLPALRALGRSVAEKVTTPSYLELQRRDDSDEGYAKRRYWKGHYLPALPDAAIDALLSSRRTELGISLQTYGGAIGEVDETDSAFSHRATQFEYVVATGWTDPDEDEARKEATRHCAAALDTFAGGAYVNVLNDEGRGGVERAYSRQKLARLTALKDIYDPDNLFHLNHNIVPSGH
ncbi:MAG: FAD-binding oxidoreductase [Solirubrobacteraceae bacterium]